MAVASDNFWRRVTTCPDEFARVRAFSFFVGPAAAPGIAEIVFLEAAAAQHVADSTRSPGPRPRRARGRLFWREADPGVPIRIGSLDDVLQECFGPGRPEDVVAQMKKRVLAMGARVLDERRIANDPPAGEMESWRELAGRRSARVGPDPHRKTADRFRERAESRSRSGRSPDESRSGSGESGEEEDAMSRRVNWTERIEDAITALAGTGPDNPMKGALLANKMGLKRPLLFVLIGGHRAALAARGFRSSHRGYWLDHLSPGPTGIDEKPPSPASAGMNALDALHRNLVHERAAQPAPGPVPGGNAAPRGGPIGARFRVTISGPGLSLERDVAPAAVGVILAAVFSAPA